MHTIGLSGKSKKLLILAGCSVVLAPGFDTDSIFVLFLHFSV